MPRFRPDAYVLPAVSKAEDSGFNTALHFGEGYMRMKNGKIPSFRSCVESRYQTDLVMNGFATALVLLVPMVVLLIVSIVSGVGKYEVLGDFVPGYTLVCITIELFVIMVVTYNLYIRLYSHSRRDRVWRKSLIQYVASKGGNTERMEGCDRFSERQEVFSAMFFVRILLGIMLLFTFWVMIYVVPVLPSVVSGAPDYHLIIGGSEIGCYNSYWFSVFIGCLLCFIMFLSVFVSLLSFTFGHEQRQVDFSRCMVDSLAEVGIDVLPMTPVVRKTSKLLGIFLFLFTGPFFILFLVFKVFRNMNNHLMNDWVYEEELLKAVESDGRCGFDSKFYDRCPDRTGGRRRQQKRFSRRMKAKVRMDNELPGILVVAELFIIVLCANYILKIVVMGCDMSFDYDRYHVTWDNFISMRFSSWVRIALVLMDVYFVMTAIGAILGLASRRASSWRKVVRSCVTFVIPLWITAFITRDDGILHLFDFNVYVTTVILCIVLSVMVFSGTIRRYYSPVGHEMPPLREWIRYAFWGSLIGAVAAGVVLGEDPLDGVDDMSDDDI